MTKRIIIGDLYSWEVAKGTPIYLFRKAYNMSKLETWTTYTNNPQFIEALEVFCGEDNVEVYLRLNGKCKRISFQLAYDYLGDVYDFIDQIRGYKLAHHLTKYVDDEFVEKKLNEYNIKYLKLMEE